MQWQIPEDCLRTIYAYADIDSKVNLRKVFPTTEFPRGSVPTEILLEPPQVLILEDTHSQALFKKKARNFTFGMEDRKGWPHHLSILYRARGKGSMYRIEVGMCSECRTLYRSVWTNAQTDVSRPGWYIRNERQENLWISPNNLLGIVCEDRTCPQNFTYCSKVKGEPLETWREFFAHLSLSTSNILGSR